MKKRITSILTLILNNKFSERFITILVILNIAVFYCGIDGIIGNDAYIVAFDLFSMIIFTVEYAMRLAILKNPLDFLRPMLFLDLLSILPYYLILLPYKTTFIRLFTGCGDFVPTGNVGRLLDPLIIVISAGVHGLIADVGIPVCVRVMKKHNMIKNEA